VSLSHWETIPTDSAFSSQVDYFGVARQPGAIAITSYKASRYLSHVPVWIASGFPTIHELVLLLSDAERFDHSH